MSKKYNRSSFQKRSQISKSGICKEEIGQAFENVDFKQYKHEISNSADCFDIPVQRECKTSNFNSRQMQLNSKDKCVDWLQRIPEDAVPKSMTKSSSKFELSFYQRENLNTDTDARANVFINGRRFLKSTSDLTRSRINGQMNAYDRLEEDVHCANLMKSNPISYEKEIESAILKVLDDIGKDNLDILLQSAGCADVNQGNDSFDYDSQKTVNIVPDCEQSFNGSPHPKRKFQVADEKVGIIENNYMKIKTDIFSASTQVEDIHIGQINISIQYLIITKRLKITIESLNMIDDQYAGKLFVNVSFEQKGNNRKGKETKPIRGGKRCIMFNQEIFFGNVDIENVHLHCLRFKVFRKPEFFLKKNKCVGECFLYLDDCDVVGKVKVCKNLISCD
jgi:hypothetical protein